MRRVLGDAYRAIAAPFGARAVERMLRDGLPPRLATPLRVLFGGAVPPQAAAAAASIESLRAGLAARRETYRFAPIEDALGPLRMVVAGGDIPSSFFANAASVSRRWGLFLHLCAEAFEARAVLELGACFGISGAYLASGRSRPHLVTIEASDALAPVAEATLAAFTESAEVMRGTFEARLPEALARLGSVDVAYVDGHHDEAATLHYVRTIAPRLASNALVVLDDIRLYREMWRAWTSVAAMRGVAAAVDTGRFGLLVWIGGDAVPRPYDLARYTGWWRAGRSRRETMAPEPNL